MAANRYMMEMTANEFIYVNQSTFEVTNSEDSSAIEFVRFYLKGQSFLFNQIRKMVGCMVQIFHGNLGLGYLENTHRDNVLSVALSPGDGLLLERVAYDKYNTISTTKHPVMVRLVKQKEEIDQFRREIVSFIC